MDLFKLFVENYTKYKDFLKKEPTDVFKKLCMTLFGVPGVGKSTFLARLLSNISPEEFFEMVILRKTEYISIEDVEIGKSVTSVTMTPRLYEINDVLLYDVPGFKDADKNKNIVINILHKCLLNHIQKNKFIVVMKMSLLDDERMNNLITDYHRSFRLLFGENYRTCIENIYFVITHIDKCTIKIEELPSIIMERTMSSIDFDEKDLSFFVKRLSRAHIVVNYEKDSQKDVIFKLTNMIKDKSNGMTQDQIIKTQLNTFENDLDKEIVRMLSELILNFKLKYENIIKKIDAQHENIKISKSQILLNENLIISKTKQIEEIKDFLNTVDSKIFQFKNDITKLLASNLLNLKQATDIDSLINTFDKVMGEFEVISYRCDNSKSGVMKYYVDLKINLNSNYNKNKMILALRHEPDDISFKRYLKSDSLIPENLQKISEFKESIVLYNNGILESSFKVTKNNHIENIIDFEAEYKDPFKVYVYTNTIAKYANVDYKMKKKLIDEQKIFGQNAKNNLIDIEKIELDIKNISLKDQDKRNEQLKLENELSELNNNNVKEDDNCKKGLNDIMEFLISVLNLKTTILEDNTFKNAKNIEQIFKENKIVCGFSNQIKEINTMILGFTNYCDNTKKVYF